MENTSTITNWTYRAWSIIISSRKQETQIIRLKSRIINTSWIANDLCEKNVLHKKIDYPMKNVLTLLDLPVFAYVHVILCTLLLSRGTCCKVGLNNTVRMDKASKIINYHKLHHSMRNVLTLYVIYKIISKRRIISMKLYMLNKNVLPKHALTMFQNIKHKWPNVWKQCL